MVTKSHCMFVETGLNHYL